VRFSVLRGFLLPLRVLTSRARTSRPMLAFLDSSRLYLL
jgi:hypothetical protein